MKKEPIIDPALKVGGIKQEIHATEKLELQLGDVLRIGHPSNRYYQFLSPQLDAGQLSIEDLKTFRAVRGVLAKVMGILSLKKRNQVAVLVPYDQTDFLEGTDRIYADVDKALDSMELLPEQLGAKERPLPRDLR